MEQDSQLLDGLCLLQALLPVGNSCDLFYHPPPLFPSSQLYLLRPLLPLDKVGVTAEVGGSREGVPMSLRPELTGVWPVQGDAARKGLPGSNPAQSRPAWAGHLGPRPAASALWAGELVLCPAALAGTITHLLAMSTGAEHLQAASSGSGRPGSEGSSRHSLRHAGTALGWPHCGVVSRAPPVLISSSTRKDPEQDGAGW